MAHVPRVGAYPAELLMNKSLNAVEVVTVKGLSAPKGSHAPPTYAIPLHEYAPAVKTFVGVYEQVVVLAPQAVEATAFEYLRVVPR